MQISIPVSVGELFDKISILNNKLRFIEDKDKLRNIEREFLLLNEVAINLDPLYAINENFKKLSSINEELWFIEDGKRLHEKNKVFDSDFIELARKVYRKNDERAHVKRLINEQYGSSIVEEKSYDKY
jgi:hypothetical protein